MSVKKSYPGKVFSKLVKNYEERIWRRIFTWLWKSGTTLLAKGWEALSFLWGRSRLKKEKARPDPMIGYLKGTVLHLSGDECLILVRDVAYRVILPKTTLPSLQQEVALWIEPIVHEGQTRLYGFLTPEERQWFCWLIQVPGVGGRVAQHILSSFPPKTLCPLILSEQKTQLQKAEGVGAKLAARLISELRDKAHKWMMSESSPLITTSSKEETVLALCALGYKRQDAERATAEVQALFPSCTSEEKLKLALQRLATHG